ncbi:OmpA family protein [Alphaproteobacteria bacterium]|nr:OmpA family protein [Alphaproteobacteria bacterium]
MLFGFTMLAISFFLAGCVDHLALNKYSHSYKKSHQDKPKIFIKADNFPLKRIVEIPSEQTDTPPAMGKDVAKSEQQHQPTRAEIISYLSRPIFFELDAYHLSAKQQKQLGELATFMKQPENINLKIRIEGHCDDRGTRDYNFALGSRRASSVMQMLEIAGIVQTRMKFISYGKERPAYLGVSEPSRAQNRRADLLIRPDFQSALTGPSS